MTVTEPTNEINIILETKWCVCGHHYDDHFIDGWGGNNRKLRPCILGCGFPKGCCRISVKCPCIEFVATKVKVPYVVEKTKAKYEGVSSSKDNSKLRIDPFPPKIPEVEQYYPSKPVKGSLLPWAIDAYKGKLGPKFTALSFAADAKGIDPAKKLEEIDRELENIRRRAARSKSLVDRIISGEDRNLL